MKVAYRDLRIKDPALKAELLAAVDRVLSHGRILLGPEHAEFEAAVAKQCGRKHAIGVNSGSDALFLALRALDVGPGDEVITTALSWIATANAITLTGAKPVFVDIGDDLNIDAARIEAAITPRTRAIAPVHFTGQLCDIETILAIAQRRGLHVVEDAAQAYGAKRNGRIAGSFGTLSAFSMNPMKVLNAFGEAGCIVTDDDALRDKLVALRYNGTINRHDCKWPGLNGRLDTMQAAMLLVMLKHVPAKIEAKRRIARLYDERLGNVVRCPRENSGNYHTYYAYTVQCDRRDGLMQFLGERGVETQIQHPIAMPDHTAYKNGASFDVPNARRLVNEILALPNQEDLTPAELDHVCNSVSEFYAA